MSSQIFRVIFLTFALLPHFSTATLATLSPGCRANLIYLPNFDAGRFLGTWYRLEYLHVNTSAEQPGPYKCVSSTYSATDGKITATAAFQDVLTGIWNSDHANISFPNPPTPAVWNADWETFGPPLVESVVLGTDYDNFAYTYACQPQANGISKQIVNIWSRRRTLNILTHLLLRLTLIGLGFLGSETVIFDQTDCIV